MTSTGRLTIPEEIRKRLAVEPCDAVSLVPGGDHAVTICARRRLRTDEVRVSLPANGITATPERIEADLGAAIVESVLRR